MFIICLSVGLSVLFVGCESQSATCATFQGPYNTCATGTSIVNVDYPRIGNCDLQTSSHRDCDNDANKESCRSTCESLAVTSNLASGCCSFRAHLASGSNGIDPSTGKYGCLYYEGSQGFTHNGNSDIYAGMCSTYLPTAAPTLSPTPAPTLSPTHAPTVPPSNAPTVSPTFSPTFSPTLSPTRAPTFSPSRAPTKTPTESPTLSPTNVPTLSPTDAPTTSPSSAPTRSPTDAPTLPPTSAPTRSPTDAPSMSPTNAPTASPTDAPTTSPSSAPTCSPTNAPTTSPTSAPTISPTEAPTTSPSSAPTRSPTDAPTTSPTVAPTSFPTAAPTSFPTDAPTLSPTESPTYSPTDAPTVSPVRAPTSAPTASPTFCLNADYFRVREFASQSRFSPDVASKWKQIDEAILLGDETVISENCLYSLRLELDGNLILYDLSDTAAARVVWRTNVTLVNQYGDNDEDVQSAQLQFFLSGNTLWLLEDKFPSVVTLHPNVLWTSSLTEDSDIADMDGRDGSSSASYRLFVTNDGVLRILDSENNNVWVRPQLIVNSSTTAATDTPTMHESADESNGNDGAATSASADVFLRFAWLWIILIITAAAVACVFLWCVLRHTCSAGANKNAREAQRPSIELQRAAHDMYREEEGGVSESMNNGEEERILAWYQETLEVARGDETSEVSPFTTNHT